MPKISAVLFDLDNTLIDFVKMKKECCRAAAHAMVAAGLKMGEDEAFCGLMEKYFEVGIESDVAFTEFLKQQGQFDHKVLAAGLNAYLAAKTDFVVPYTGVPQTLKQLKEQGLTLGVVTDAPKTKAYQRLLHMGIDEHFRFVVGFEDTNHQKHTGLPLALALKLLKQMLPNIKNSEVAMVGDSFTRDIAPAKKLGLKTVLAKYGQLTPQNGKADFEIDNIKELTTILL
ncbi:MAG: HAD family hydrolase [Candidatus Bathyarchaeia archaeon]